MIPPAATHRCDKLIALHKQTSEQTTCPRNQHTQNIMIERRHREEMQPQREDKLFKLRNILNIIFMVGALAGIIIYFCHLHQPGIIVILIAMVFKMVESALRFFH